jgi:hypothetical protein
MKSRMPRSPWRGDRLVLEDGVSSNGAPVYVAPKPALFDAKSAS